MKTQVVNGIFLSLLGLAVGAGVALSDKPEQASLKEKLVHEHVASSVEKLKFINAAFAQDAGDDTCNQMAMDTIQACFQKNADYQHGALQHFNNTLCMMNSQFPVHAETALCHFRRSMEMNPDKSALPQTITKTFDGMSVELSVVAPTESFAQTAGYDAKAMVTVDDVQFMTLYWGGEEDSSNGFLISAAAGMGGGASSSRPMYLQWDRTDNSAQSVKVFAAKYSTSYLTSSCERSEENMEGCDSAIYGEASFNSTSKLSTVQIVSIEDERGAAEAFKCYRVYASGTKGGEISIIKSANAGEATNSTSVDATGMEAGCFSDTDSGTLANGSGNVADCSAGDTSSFYSSVSFTKSCADVFGADSDAFAGDDVDFAATTTDIF